MKKNKHIGGSLEDFLAEEGILEECTKRAIKDILADEVRETMTRDKISKAEMARRISTSRPSLDRFLDSNNYSINFGVMERAAKAVGRQLLLQLR